MNGALFMIQVAKSTIACSEFRSSAPKRPLLEVGGDGFHSETKVYKTDIVLTKGRFRKA